MTSEVKALRLVRIIHTIVWAVFAGAIVALPVIVWLGERRVATALIGLISIELAVLAANRGAVRLLLLRRGTRTIGDPTSTFICLSGLPGGTR